MDPFHGPCRLCHRRGTLGLEENRSAADLRRRLAALDAERDRLQAELVALGPGEPLPGLHLAVEVAGRRALLPAGRVLEVVPLVPFSPLPRPVPHVRGAFLYRGQPAVALDLASLTGVPREPDLDAHLVVLASHRPFALLVDRAQPLPDPPVVAPGGADAGDLWRGSALVAALCRCGAEVVPLLATAALERALAAEPA
jgi:purine-binding chemotaxis protein CheW